METDSNQLISCWIKENIKNIVRQAKNVHVKTERNQQRNPWDLIYSCHFHCSEHEHVDLEVDISVCLPRFNLTPQFKHSNSKWSLWATNLKHINYYKSTHLTHQPFFFPLAFFMKPHLSLKTTILFIQKSNRSINSFFTRKSVLCSYEFFVLH